MSVAAGSAPSARRATGPPRPGPRGGSTRQTGRGLLAVASMALLATVVLVTAGDALAATAATTPQRSTRQTDDSAPIRIEDVTPWVAADGTFSVTLRTSDSIPADAALTWTVGQRIRADDGDLRAATAEFLAGDGSARNLQAPRTVALGTLEQVQPDTAGPPGDLRRLSFPIRPGSGDETAILVPTAGIHPVNLEVTAGDDVIWDSTVFLNRLPVDMPTTADDTAGTTAVQLLVGLDSGPTLSVDQPAAIPTEEVPAVSSIQTLLGESLDLPLTVGLRPNTLLGLQRSERPADRAFVTSLVGAEWSFAPQSYVRVDAAALAAAPGDELQKQIAAGTSINAAVAGREPSTLWILDDTVDPAAAAVLESTGVTHVITSAERLVVTEEGEDLGPSQAEAVLRSRSVRLDGAAALSVSSYDVELSRLLVEPGLEAPLRAHRAITELMSEWLAAAAGADEGGFPPLSAAVVLTPGVGGEVLQRLAAMLSAEGPVQIAAPPSGSDNPTAPLARLRELDPASATSVVRTTQRTRDHIAGWRSMTTPTDEFAAELDLVNDQVPSRFIDDGTRTALNDSVEDALAARVSQVQVPEDRTIVLTSRSGSIPLRFRNDTGAEVRIAMRLRSPRLDFPQGSVTEILLAPGDNRVDVPVEVRAAGSSVLRLELSSPDRRIDIPDASVTVRSSSISGVGAALSALSIVVLAVWWIRTHRSRRGDADATPGTGGDAQDPSEDGSGGEATSGTGRAGDDTNPPGDGPSTVSTRQPGDRDGD